MQDFWGFFGVIAGYAVALIALGVVIRFILNIASTRRQVERLETKLIQLEARIDNIEHKEQK